MDALQNDLRIGTLLVESRLVPQPWVERAVTLSSYTGLPLGKCLVLLGCLLEEELRAAVEAQSLIRDSLLTKHDMKTALGVVRRKQWPLCDALISLGIDAHFVRGTRLGELLYQAGSLDEKSLQFALNLGDYSGLPLGRVLLLLHEIAPTCLEVALKTQKGVRAGLIEKDKAIELLKSSQLKSKLINALKCEAAALGAAVRFGELFVCASVLTESEVEAAVAEAKGSGKMLGQLLLERNKISEPLLVAAVNLQDQVWKAKVSINEAADVLSGIHQLDLSVSGGFSRIGLTYSCIGKNLLLCDFLRAAGYLTREVLEELIDEVRESPAFAAYKQQETREIFKNQIKRGLRNEQFLLHFLKQCRPTNGALLNTAVVLHELIQGGKMTIEQAVLQFNLRKLDQGRKVA